MTSSNRPVVSRRTRRAKSWRATACLALLAATAAACAPTRPVVPEATLIEQRTKRDAATLAMVPETLTRMLAEVKARYERDKERGVTAPPTVNVLALSGGGDYGAYAAGVLNGWGSVTAPGMERPKFDVVMGVSTGALIAPFAYLGDQESYRQVLDLYMNPKSDWVVSRGFLYFLPSNVSFAEIPGLERELRTHVNREMVQRIAAESEKGRLVMVNTTDLDAGEQRVWDLSAVGRECMEKGDIEKFHQVLLASSGIPGAFPARTIDGGLYVDGGVTANLIYGGRISERDFLPALWKKAYPDLPPLRIRYWVIFNNWLLGPARTTQPNWPPVVARSVELSIRSASLVALRHLYAMAEVVNLKGPGTMEVRLLAIPEDWRPPVEGVFQKETMSSLAELGAKLGADPSSWRTTSP